MLIATQHFSTLKEKLGKTFGNCRTLIFFRPEYVDFADISKLTGVDAATLASLEQGKCLVYGLLYDKTAGKNKQVTVIGWTYINQVLRKATSNEPRLNINRFKFRKS